MKIDGSTTVDILPTKSREALVSESSDTVQLPQPASFQPQQPSGSDGREIPLDKLEQALDSMNEILEINNSELKFVYHEGLEKYYAQLVNSKTNEVVREIPSKKILDVFFEMQKLVGMVVDEKI